MHPFKSSGWEALVSALADSPWEDKVRQSGWTGLKYIIIFTFRDNSNQYFPFLLSRNVHHNFSIILCPFEILDSRREAEVE